MTPNPGGKTAKKGKLGRSGKQAVHSRGKKGRGKKRKGTTQWSKEKGLAQDSGRSQTSKVDIAKSEVTTKGPKKGGSMGRDYYAIGQKRPKLTPKSSNYAKKNKFPGRQGEKNENLFHSRSKRKQKNRTNKIPTCTRPARK